MKDITALKRQTMGWKAFITNSMKRPKLGQWSDMCLAPVDTYVLVHCEARKPYSFYDGLGIGVCIQRPAKGYDEPQYQWHLVGETDKQGIFNYTKCNPHWWQPLPLSPPERPRSTP